MPQKDTLYGDLFVVGNFEANLIKKTGGTSSEFLKADGSVDSTAYLTTTPTLDQVTTAGNTTTNSIIVGGLTVATNLIYTDLVNNRVFIGDTTSPQVAKLTIKSSDNSASGLGFVIYNTSTATNSYSAFKLYANNGAAEGQFYVDGLGGSMVVRTYTNHPMIFGTNATERLRIFANGNVGIGTTTDAGYKLDVNGTGRFVDTIRIAQSGLLRNADITMGTNLSINSSHGGIYLSVAGNAYQYITTSLNQLFNKVQINYGTQLITRNASLSVGGTITAATALAQGVIYDGTLVAAANNDVLVGLDINPTFTSGAFTGLGKIAARIQSGALLVGTTLLNTDVISFPVQVNGSSQNIGAVWRNALSTGYTSFRFYNDQNLNTRAMEMGYAGSAYPSAIVTGGVTGESAYLTTTGAYPLQLGTNNTARFIVFSNGNVGVGTATDAGQKLQVIGSVFIKGTDSLSSTKVFEVQNGAGASIMDFRNATYAFFGCGQGGGSNSGFIFNYSNTSYTQFAGYNYGAGAGSYKPILMDTDTGGRNQGIFVNFGVTTNTPPNSDTEFGVLGRTSDSTTYISRFRNSGNTDKFAIRADGALFTNTLQGYSGTLNIPTNPPGTSNITITNGLITNIA